MQFEQDDSYRKITTAQETILEVRIFDLPPPNSGFCTCCSLKTPRAGQKKSDFFTCYGAEQTMLQTIQQYFNKFTKENTLRLPEYLVATNLCSMKSLVWVEFSTDFAPLVVSEKGISHSQQNYARQTNPVPCPQHVTEKSLTFHKN